MRKLFAAMALVLTAIGTPAMAETQGDQLAALPAPVVTIGSVYWGTGFFVDGNGHVLTAKHLISDCARIEIVGGRTREPASIVAISETDDLGLLRVSRTFGKPAAFDTGGPPSGGAMVTILGYKPLGEALRARGPGEPAAYNSMLLDRDESRQISLVSGADAGTSGSPVVTKEGLVIGILQSKLIRQPMLVSTGQPDETRLAVSGAVALEFMRRNGIAAVEGGQPAKLTRLGDFAAAEVKVECHR
jgi:hypothetical protein